MFQVKNNFNVKINFFIKMKYFVLNLSMLLSFSCLNQICDARTLSCSYLMSCSIWWSPWLHSFSWPQLAVLFPCLMPSHCHTFVNTHSRLRRWQSCLWLQALFQYVFCQTLGVQEALWLLALCMGWIVTSILECWAAVDWFHDISFWVAVLVFILLITSIQYNRSVACLSKS